MRCRAGGAPDTFFRGAKTQLDTSRIPIPRERTVKSETHGTEREKQVRDIAARLGVADFVYSARPIPKGSASREASGDGLIIAGARGAVLQVKARDPDSVRSDSEERATSWVRKQAVKACNQGVGTKRELARRRAAGEPVVVSPVRAAALSEESRRRYELTVSAETEDWPIIVVLDHPLCPEIDLGLESGVIWLTFQDWLALHRRLRSTVALLNYCQRILSDKIHVPLGREAQRYATMSAADEEAASSVSGSLPYLADSDAFDSLGTDLFHDVINKVWHDDGDIPWRSAAEYRRIVEFLDSVPPQGQSVVGNWFLRKRSELSSGQHTATGLIRLHNRDRLVYGCSHRKHWEEAKFWGEEFSALTALRHAHALESGAPNTSITLGVGALVEERNGRQGVSYTFFLLDGLGANLLMPTDLRLSLEWKYGIHNHRLGTTKEAKVDRNQPCPCMSGRKFKTCCGR